MESSILNNEGQVNPKKVGRPRKKIMYEVDETSKCWNWLGFTSPDGYGKLHRKGLPQLAHRALYEICKGKIPAGKQLDHLCRNRRCVNPDHLEEVSNVENCHRGLRSKLSKEKVEYIRFLYANGCCQQAIAAFYDLAPGNVSAIVTGKTWRSI